MTRPEPNAQLPEAPRPQGCSRADFALGFRASFRKLWLIAAAVAPNRELADDIVQEAAVVALGKLDQFEPGTNFAAWMGQMVRYVALNQGRREQRRRGQALDDVAEPRAGPQGDPPEPATLGLSMRGALPGTQEDFDDRVIAALAKVNQTARACLLLRTMEGLNYAEISELLEIPEGTAMSHVHRTRRFLRERLMPEPKVSGSLEKNA
jgi:RNA polymerase sigma-70 factor (ECF subfamily)